MFPVSTSACTHCFCSLVSWFVEMLSISNVTLNFLVTLSFPIWEILLSVWLLRKSRKLKFEKFPFFSSLNWNEWISLHTSGNVKRQKLLNFVIFLHYLREPKSCINWNSYAHWYKQSYSRVMWYSLVVIQQFFLLIRGILGRISVSVSVHRRLVVSTLFCCKNWWCYLIWNSSAYWHKVFFVVRTRKVTFSSI